MTSRIRLIITLAVISHLILLTPLVISQLPPPKEAGTGVSAEEADKQKPLSSRITTSTAVPSDEVVIRAREQEKTGDIYKLRGDVEVTYRRYTVRAENVTYNSDTGDLEAEGGVTFDGGPRDEHLTATHGPLQRQQRIRNFLRRHRHHWRGLSRPQRGADPPPTRS
jgi:LPS-assembly protein